MINTGAVGAHLDAYTYQRLLDDALAMIPDTVDKRRNSSIIYDTLAVSDAQLAEGYTILKGYYLDCYALTARGAYLDLRVAEAGVTREAATAAVKRASFAGTTGNPVTLPIGARFSTESDTNALIFAVTGAYLQDGVPLPGEYQLTCETTGTVANDYTGALLPLGNLTGVASAQMTELLIPAKDVETDDALLVRYLEVINQPAFGGNVAQYRQWVSPMDGVGAVQIYPTANGGGTVGVSIIGADYSPASTTLINAVQAALDPPKYHALGLGLAPIGHFVTVVTPQEVTVSVEATLTLQTGMVLGQVEDAIRAILAAYLLDRRRQFGATGNNNLYEINIYRARIAAEIMRVDGVENVTDLLLNDADADLTLTQSAQLQQLPVEGSVVLHAI